MTSLILSSIQFKMRLLALAASIAGAAASSNVQVFKGSPWDPRYTAMAQATLAQMNLTEKLTMVHGTGSTKPYVGDVPANTRLNIPTLNLEDGPQGVADGVKDVGSSHANDSSLRLQFMIELFGFEFNVLYHL